jgi:Kef-type K+ transport system membrane component KefB
MLSENILAQLFVIFAAAKIAGEIFERLKQPAVIGELLVGVGLGSHALGVIGDSDVHHVLQELGAIVLLFMVGLDTRLEDIREVGARALTVGSLGIIVPFASGAAYTYAVKGSLDEALFLGAAMVATSVGITARVFSDLGVIHALESRIILGAAVVDDVLGLLVLALVSGLAGGDFSIGSIITLAITAIGFIIVVGAFGGHLVHRAAPAIDGGRIPRTELSVALAVCLGLSALAGFIGLAAIIGAFLAGMAFSDLRDRWGLEGQIQPVYELLVPFFFVITGSLVDPGFFTQPATIGMVVVVTLLAIAGKLIGCGGAAWGMGWRSISIVGVGMVPRGEVGIIVATVGLSSDVISEDLYGVVVAMSILTTLVAPPVLKWLFAGRAREEEPARGAPRSREVEGIGG